MMIWKKVMLLMGIVLVMSGCGREVVEEELPVIVNEQSSSIVQTGDVQDELMPEVDVLEPLHTGDYLQLPSPVYTWTGEVPTGTVRVTIDRTNQDSDTDDSRTLSQFAAGDTTFLTNMRLDYGNIAQGHNHYVANFYDVDDKLLGQLQLGLFTLREEILLKDVILYLDQDLGVDFNYNGYNFVNYNMDSSILTYYNGKFYSSLDPVMYDDQGFIFFFDDTLYLNRNSRNDWNSYLTATMYRAPLYNENTFILDNVAPFFPCPSDTGTLTINYYSGDFLSLSYCNTLDSIIHNLSDGSSIELSVFSPYPVIIQSNDVAVSYDNDLFSDISNDSCLYENDITLASYLYRKGDKQELIDAYVLTDDIIEEKIIACKNGSYDRPNPGLSYDFLYDEGMFILKDKRYELGFAMDDLREPLFVRKRE